jgi:hypothetical protein
MSETNPIITSTDPRITEDDRALARRIIEFIEYDAGNHPMRQDHYWIVAAKIAQYRREQCCRAADIMGDDPSGIKRLVWYRDDGWEHGGAAETWKDHAEELEAELKKTPDYEEVLADHRRLVREIDVILNGEEGAAKQASLCDLVGQIEELKERLERGEAMYEGLCEACDDMWAENAEGAELERVNLEMARIANEEKNALVDTPPLERIVPAPKWDEEPWPDNGYWCGRYLTTTIGQNGEPEQYVEIEAIKPPREGLRPYYTDDAWYWMEIR